LAWLWFVLFVISFAMNVVLAFAPIVGSPIGGLAIDGVSKLLAKDFSRKVGLLLLATCVTAIAGCDELQPQVRALPMAADEVPPMNLPVALRQRNWLGPQKEGSCVHASLVTTLRWCNQFNLGERWRATYGDGEWDSRLRDRLDAAGVDYVFTVNADPRFLDAVSMSRRGCILWWKPSHCCTFAGWVKGADGKQYAAIIDNNHPEKIEFTEREQFCRLWAGYGGFALTPVSQPPASSIPYRSYEVI
jgi:hypothetical protein